MNHKHWIDPKTNLECLMMSRREGSQVVWSAYVGVTRDHPVMRREDDIWTDKNGAHVALTMPEGVLVRQLLSFRPDGTVLADRAGTIDNMGQRIYWIGKDRLDSYAACFKYCGELSGILFRMRFVDSQIKSIVKARKWATENRR